jgi:hypothetical protein
MLVVNYGGKTQTLAKGDVRYDGVLKRIKDNRLDDIPAFLEAEEFRKGRVTIKGDDAFIDKVKMPEVLKKKIVEFQAGGFPFAYLEKFWDKLKKNPNERSREHLFAFLEHNGHPITQRGTFIAYKKVREDYRDLYSRTYDNSPGKEVTMERSKVDDNPAVTCSNGLHVASWNYANTDYNPGSGVMIEVEVDPQDVVCVPNDYNGQKMRCCRYISLGKTVSPDTSVSRRVPTPAVLEKSTRQEEKKETTKTTGIERCYGRDGFVDFRVLGAIMGISQVEMSKIMHADVSTLRRGAKSPENQERARLLIRIIERVAQTTTPHIKSWMRDRHEVWKRQPLKVLEKKDLMTIVTELEK